MTQSSDGQQWSDDFIPHKDGTPTEHGFVTMMPYQGKFLTAWLDGRNTGGGSHDGHGHGDGGPMTLRSALIAMDGTMENEVELDQRICDCCQTSGAITDIGPVIVYRDRSDEEIRDMSIVRFVDGKWSDPKTIHADGWKIEGCPVNGPRATAHGNLLAVAWFTAANSQPKVKLIFSQDGGANFWRSLHH